MVSTLLIASIVWAAAAVVALAMNKTKTAMVFGMGFLILVYAGITVTK